MKRRIFISSTNSWKTVKAIFREKHITYGYGSFAIKRLIITTYTKKFQEELKIKPK